MRVVRDAKLKKKRGRENKNFSVTVRAVRALRAVRFADEGELSFLSENYHLWTAVCSDESSKLKKAFIAAINVEQCSGKMLKLFISLFCLH